MKLEVIQAWDEAKAAIRRLASLAIDANAFATVEAIAHHEIEQLVRETADEWDNKSRFRVLLTYAGLSLLIDFAKTLATKFLRKYLREP